MEHHGIRYKRRVGVVSEEPVVFDIEDGKVNSRVQIDPMLFPRGRNEIEGGHTNSEHRGNRGAKNRRPGPARTEAVKATAASR